MDDVILKATNVSKQYRLGTVGRGSLHDDLVRLLARLRGKEDPFLKVGSQQDRNKAAASDYLWALRDINFEVARGEVLGIIGKNGAGKSTLLKLLSRVTAPTSGTIKSRGRIASLLEVGTGFNPELTGRENIYLNGAILGMSRDEITSKLDEIVEFSGCTQYIDTPTKRYSSGMTVRLAFAVAAHLEPEILVVDEVLAVGDAEFQKKAIGKMQDISTGAGRTVLFVSHNMASIQQLCNRALLLEQGSVKMSGSVADVVAHYLSRNGNQDEGSLVKQINNAERTGSMEVALKEAVLIVDEGQQKPQTGKPLGFRFYLKNFNNENIATQNLRLDFRIDDHTGQRLLWFSTAIYPQTAQGGAKHITFHLDKLPLNSGSYIVTTYLTFRNQVADWAKNAFQFKVAEGFYYDSLSAVHTEQTKVLTDFKLAYND